MNRMQIRDGAAGDRPAIEALYGAAFLAEDLLPLLRELLPHPSVALSLVAEIGQDLVGHIVFTGCPDRVVLLGPLAVAPTRQKQGIGKALVHGGLEGLERAGWVRVLVLGDPAYYGRLGFTFEYQSHPFIPVAQKIFGKIQPGPGKPLGTRHFGFIVNHLVIRPGCNNVRKIPHGLPKVGNIFNRPLI